MGEANKTVTFNCSSERGKKKPMHNAVILVERHDDYKQVMLDIYSHLSAGRDRILMFLDIESAKKLVRTLNAYIRVLEKLK